MMNVSNSQQEEAEEDLVIRFLLGELTEDEHDRFEGRYFGDDRLVKHLEAIRDDLIDSYLDGNYQLDNARGSGNTLSPLHITRENFERPYHYEVY